MKIKITALFVTICLILSVFPLGGCEKREPPTEEQLSNETETTVNITRGQWLTMLAEAFGLDTYSTATPFFTDVLSGNPLYPYVQAASEWEILSVFSGNTFDADKEVTRKEIAYTAVAAVGYAGDDAIRFAEENGIIQSGAAQSGGVSLAECESAVEAAKNYYLFAPGAEIIDVKPNSGIANISGYHVEIQGNTLTTTDKIELEKDNIILTAPTAEHPFGIAYKVTGVTTDGDSTVIEVTTPELGDLYDEINVHTTVPADLDKIIWGDGITVSDTGIEETSFNTSTDGYYALLAAGPEEKPQVTLLAGESDAFRKVFTISKAQGKFSKTWTEKYAPALSSSDGGRALEKSNFVYSGTPSIDDFSGKDVSWLKQLETENKFSSGYSITGTLDIREITITTDVVYSKKYKKEKEIVKINADVAANLVFEGNLEGEIEIARVPIPVAATGLTVTVHLYLYVDASGSLQIKTELQYTEKAEKKREDIHRHAESDFEMKTTASAAVDLEFGTDLAVSLDALGMVELIDVGVRAGVDLTAEASISGKCETSTKNGVTTKTYTESLNMEATVYLPLVKVYVASEKTLISKIIDFLAGENATEWEVISKDNAKKYKLYDNSWVFWSETIVTGARGEILSDEVTIGDFGTYRTRFAETNHISTPVFEFDYPTSWEIASESVSRSLETVTLTSANGTRVVFYLFATGSIEGGGSGVVSYLADISKYADSSFVPGYVPAGGATVDYTNLGKFMVARIQTKDYDRITGEESVGPVKYAVLPEARTGTQWDNRADMAAFSFDYSGYVSFMAYPLAESDFTSNDFEEAIAILSSFRVYEEEIDDPVYDALLKGDYSMFAGTYSPLDRFNNWYTWDEETIPDLVLFADGLADGGQLYESNMYSNQKPYTVTVNLDGSYTCHVRAEDSNGPNVTYEYFIIYPPGTAITNSYLQNDDEYSPDAVYLYYVYAMGGVKDIVYVRNG